MRNSAWNKGHRSDPVPRFWAKVQKGDDDDCWEWIGACDHFGYGVLVLVTSPRRTVRAHRFAYERLVGPIPAGRQVLHGCDNPPCVNPAHLRVGSAKDNAEDRERRGRGGQAAGEQNSNAKLTDAQVAEIRKRWQAGATQTALAPEYGIGQAHVSRLVRRLQRA